MAVSGYFDAVQKIYIAFYQRPADPAGLRYWAERLEAADGDSTTIINAFANSAEAQRLYGPINDDTIGDVVGNIYQALFGREPDAAGKAYYEAAFADGTLTAGNIALAILNASKNDDQTVIANKLIVANKFTEKVDGRALDNPEFGKGDDFAYEYTEEGKAEAVRKALAAVTSDPKSILNDIGVKDVLEDKVPAPGGGHQGKTFELSTNNDTFTGQSGNDTFVAKLKAVLDPVPENPAGGSAQDAAGGPPWQSLNNGDTLVGGSGRDVLEAELIGMNKVTPSLTSIETIALSGMGSLSLASSTGVENIHVNGMDASKLQYGDVDDPEDNDDEGDDSGDSDGSSGFGGLGDLGGLGIFDILGGSGSSDGSDGSGVPDLGIGMAAISVKDIGAPLKSLTVTDTLGIVSLDHLPTVSAGNRPLELNLRDAIAMVAISRQDDGIPEPVYESLTINSSSARTGGVDPDEKTYGNYMLLASPTPSNIVVKGDVNFGLITGIIDGEAPGVLNATGLSGNLAAVLVGEGSTKATGGTGEDLLAFVSPGAIDSGSSSSDMGGSGSKITVDGGAGHDAMIFVSDADIDAKGDEGNDNFVFVNLQGSTGFNVNDSVDGGDGVDTLWLATVDSYDDDDVDPTGNPAIKLFGDAPADGEPNNISGIEHVVHVGLGQNSNIEADMDRVDGATLELAGGYGSSTVTVNNIDDTSSDDDGSSEKADVIFSGWDVETLSLNGKETINLTVRTMSEDRNPMDWLFSKFGDEPSLDILPALHNADTYAQLLGMLKQTGSEVNIGNLQVGANTETLNLNLENIGLPDSEHSDAGYANALVPDCVGQVNILDMSSLGSGVSEINIGGNSNLTLGSDFGVSGVQEIDASGASGSLDIYLEDNGIKVTAGSGVDTIVYSVAIGPSNLYDSRDDFKGNISRFNVKKDLGDSVEKDRIGIENDVIDITGTSGTVVQSGAAFNMLEVDADDNVINPANISFLKFNNVETDDAGDTFEALFELAIGNTEVEAGSNAKLLAIMYDESNEEAVLFTINAGGDGLIGVEDAHSIQIITTIGMNESQYSDFDADNLWMA